MMLEKPVQAGREEGQTQPNLVSLKLIPIINSELFPVSPALCTYFQQLREQHKQSGKT